MSDKITHTVTAPDGTQITFTEPRPGHQFAVLGNVDRRGWEILGRAHSEPAARRVNTAAHHRVMRDGHDSMQTAIVEL